MTVVVDLVALVGMPRSRRSAALAAPATLEAAVATAAAAACMRWTMLMFAARASDVDGPAGWSAR